MHWTGPAVSQPRGVAGANKLRRATAAYLCYCLARRAGFAKIGGVHIEDVKLFLKKNRSPECDEFLKQADMRGPVIVFCTVPLRIGMP